MINVWLNRTFSSAYHAVNLIRDNPARTPVTVFGSHETLDAIFLGACDHRSVEPDLAGAAYVDWALAFCARHAIDVFVPKRHLPQIAAERDAFEAAGTRVLVAGTAEALAAVSDKGALYRTLERIAPDAVPAHRVVATAAEFADANDAIAATGAAVCFKPVAGEGGGGFRMIDTERSALAALSDFPAAGISLASALHALGSVENFPPLLVSELLTGDEFSVDCLADDGELLVAVPRRKLDARTQRIERAPDLVAIAGAVIAEYALSGLINVQFLEGPAGPKVIDVNPRMSAGVDVCAAAGVNLPWLAIEWALGHPVRPVEPDYGVTVARIPHIVRLERALPPALSGPASLTTSNCSHQGW